MNGKVQSRLAYIYYSMYEDRMLVRLNLGWNGEVYHAKLVISCTEVT